MMRIIFLLVLARVGMGNYSIIMIIMIILLATIDIVYFSLTSANRNWQLSRNNRDSQRNICKFQCNLTIQLTVHDVFTVFHYKS